MVTLVTMIMFLSDSGDDSSTQAAQKRQVLAPVELFLLCLYAGGVEVGV